MDVSGSAFTRSMGIFEEYALFSGVLDIYLQGQSFEACGVIAELSHQDISNAVTSKQDTSVSVIHWDITHRVLLLLSLCLVLPVLLGERVWIPFQVHSEGTLCPLIYTKQ